jgi:hypothetical protein
MLFHFIQLNYTEFYENVTSGSKDIDIPLYLKPEMPLGRIGPTANNWLFFPS